jgi:hypothetical protein
MYNMSWPTAFAIVGVAWAFAWGLINYFKLLK